jgi:hypothetical protein
MLALLGAAVATARDQHIKACVEATCGIEASAGTASGDTPTLVPVHAHGCACHVGVAMLVVVTASSTQNARHRAVTFAEMFDGQPADQPALRPPIA